MKIKNKIVIETVVEITEKDETIVKIGETKNETETLKTMQAVIKKAFGLTESEKHT